MDLDIEVPEGIIAVNFALIFFAGALAGASGVGGGAIYVPLFIILFGLVYEAIPLSKAAVCGAAIAFFVFNIAMPVPKVTRHANRFAYDAIMVMEPATLLGTVFGVLASRMCPYWLITIMMASLLGLSARKTFQKGNKLWEKETEKGSNRSQGNHEGNIVPEPSERDRLLQINGTNSFGRQNSSDLDLRYEAVIADIGYSWQWLGWRCTFTVGLCFLSVLLAAMFADDKIMPSYTRVDCGSLGFWMMILGNSVICGIITIANVRYLIAHAPALKYQTAVQWNHKTGIRYSVLCLVAGFASALCGIGGSTIKGPILLEMGLHPTLSKATSQVMLLSTVTSSAFQFYLSGEMPLYFGISFFILGAFSGFTGKFMVDKYIEWNGRQSTIIFLLGWYIIVAALIMTCLGLIIVLGQVTPTVNWAQLGFRGVCDPLPNDMEALRWLTTFSFLSKIDV